MAFNGDASVETYVRNLGCRCRVAVETGTFQAATTKFLSRVFEQVWSLEIDLTNFAIASHVLRRSKNVTLVRGNSSETLPGVLDEILAKFPDEGVFFYLDAHWNDYWPLLDELRAIAEFKNRHRSVICIDDVKVPGRPDIPFDSYQGHDLTLEYVKPVVDQIYASYTYEYLVPVTNAERYHAKLVFTPADPGSHT